MEKAKIITLTVVGVSLCSLAGYWFVVWNVRRSLEKADWQGLAELIKAPLGDMITKTAAAQPSSSRSTKTAGWANAKPEEITSATERTDTYSAALAVGNAAMDLFNHGTALPRSSAELADVGAARQLDAWGHPFCLAEVGKQVAVISRGPSAETDSDCQDVRIGPKNLASLLPGKLYRYPSGALVFTASRRRAGGAHIGP